MALATLTLGAVTGDAVEAEANIGSNQYYTVLVGRREEGARGSRWGADEMVEISNRPEIIAAPRGINPLSKQFRFTVPLALFDRDHPDLQLVSFTDREGNNPARSRIFKVAPMLGTGRSDMSDYANGLPPSTLSIVPDSIDLARHNAPVRHVSLSFQEAAISRAQFLDGILQAITAAAPQLLNSLPGLLSEIAPDLVASLPQLLNSVGGVVNGAARPAAPAAAPPAANAVDNQVLVTLMRELITALAVHNRAAAPDAVSETATLRHRGDSHPLGHARSLGRYAGQPTRRVPYARPMDAGIISGPLLASLLGAVAGPLMQQAPQLLGVLADKPLDFLSTIIRAEAANDLQRDANQQALMRDILSETNRSMLLEQLIEKLGQGGGAAALLPLLAGTQSVGSRPQEATSVTLQFETGRMIDIGGKLKSVYAKDGDGIDLRVTLQPKGKASEAPLPRAVVDLSITDPATGKQLLTKSFRLRDVYAGQAVPLHLDEVDLAKLPAQADLQLGATLRWPTSNGKTFGVRGHHAICLAEGPVFAGFGRSRDKVIHLAHPGDDRPFWNKIWEGTTTSGSDQTRWEIDVTCRYYLRVVGQEVSNGRMETRIASEPVVKGSTRETTGKMRAGMELSVEMLNRVLSDNDTPLPAAALAALKQADLRADLDREATTRLRLRGKDGQLGAVWAFPSLMLRDVHFLEPGAQDAFGQVTEMRRTTHAFLVPDRIHFLPMRSKR